MRKYYHHWHIYICVFSQLHNSSCLLCYNYIYKHKNEHILYAYISPPFPPFPLSRSLARSLVLLVAASSSSSSSSSSLDVHSLICMLWIPPRSKLLEKEREKEKAPDVWKFELFFAKKTTKTKAKQNNKQQTCNVIQPQHHGVILTSNHNAGASNQKIKAC